MMSGPKRMWRGLGVSLFREERNEIDRNDFIGYVLFFRIPFTSCYFTIGCFRAYDEGWTLREEEDAACPQVLNSKFNRGWITLVFGKFMLKTTIYRTKGSRATAVLGKDAK